MAINVHSTHGTGKVHLVSEYFEGEQTSEILEIDGIVGWDLSAKCDELADRRRCERYCQLLFFLILYRAFREVGNAFLKL